MHADQPDKLSGGQQQRVALTRYIAVNPVVSPSWTKPQPGCETSLDMHKLFESLSKWELQQYM